MARQVRNNPTVYRIINACTALALAYSIVCIAVFLRVRGAVCSTTSAGVDLSIALVSARKDFQQYQANNMPVGTDDRYRGIPLLCPLPSEDH